jgi:hypothetical protein
MLSPPGTITNHHHQSSAAPHPFNPHAVPTPLQIVSLAIEAVAAEGTYYWGNLSSSNSSSSSS